MTVPNACNFSPRLDAYLDGELSPADRSEVETHLAACPECREELADLRRFSRSFRSMEKPAPPIEQWASVNPWADVSKDSVALRLASADASNDLPDSDATEPAPIRLPTREPNHLWYIRRLSAVAAVLFVVAAGQVVYQKLNPPEPSQRNTTPTNLPGGSGTQPVETPRKG